MGAGPALVCRVDFASTGPAPPNDVFGGAFRHALVPDRAAVGVPRVGHRGPEFPRTDRARFSSPLALGFLRHAKRRRQEHVVLAGGAWTADALRARCPRDDD